MKKIVKLLFATLLLTTISLKSFGSPDITTNERPPVHFKLSERPPVHFRINERPPVHFKLSERPPVHFKINERPPVHFL